MLDILPPELFMVVIDYIKNPLYLRTLNKKINNTILNNTLLNINVLYDDNIYEIFHKFKNIIDANHKIFNYVLSSDKKEFYDKIIGIKLDFNSICKAERDIQLTKFDKFDKFNRLKIINLKGIYGENLPQNFHKYVKNLQRLTINYTDDNFKEVIKIQSLKFIKLYDITSTRLIKKHIDFFSKLDNFSLYMADDCTLPNKIFEKLSSFKMISYYGSVNKHNIININRSKSFEKLILYEKYGTLDISKSTIKKLKICNDADVDLIVHINNNIESILFLCTFSPTIINFNNLHLYKNLKELHFISIIWNTINFESMILIEKLGLNIDDMYDKKIYLPNLKDLYVYGIISTKKFLDLNNFDFPKLEKLFATTLTDGTIVVPSRYDNLKCFSVDDKTKIIKYTGQDGKKYDECDNITSDSLELTSSDSDDNDNDDDNDDNNDATSDSLESASSFDEENDDK
jgi:hypothetical protein